MPVITKFFNRKGRFIGRDIEKSGDVVSIQNQKSQATQELEQKTTQLIKNLIEIIHSSSVQLVNIEKFKEQQENFTDGHSYEPYQKALSKGGDILMSIKKRISNVLASSEGTVPSISWVKQSLNHPVQMQKDVDANDEDEGGQISSSSRYFSK